MQNEIIVVSYWRKRTYKVARIRQWIKLKTGGYEYFLCQAFHAILRETRARIWTFCKRCFRPPMFFAVRLFLVVKRHETTTKANFLLMRGSGMSWGFGSVFRFFFFFLVWHLCMQIYASPPIFIIIQRRNYQGNQFFFKFLAGVELETSESSVQYLIHWTTAASNNSFIPKINI